MVAERQQLRRQNFGAPAESIIVPEPCSSDVLPQFAVVVDDLSVSQLRERRINLITHTLFISREANQQHWRRRSRRDTETISKDRRHDLRGHRKKPRIQDRARTRNQIRNRAAAGDSRFALGARSQFEVYFSDDSEAAKAAGEQFAQIVA